MILILNHLYLGDLILILKSSTYDDFAHLCSIWIFHIFLSILVANVLLKIYVFQVTDLISKYELKFKWSIS